MSTAAEELITRYSADSSSYIKETEAAIGATKRLAKEMKVSETAIERRARRLTQVHRGRMVKSMKTNAKAIMPDIEGVGFGGGDFANLGKVMLGSFAAIGSGAALAGYGAMRAAADFDSLLKSLESVEGQGARTKAILADLRELSKMPGIDFEDAIQAYTNLRRNKIGPDFAKSIIREFGNENARGGGGKEEFQGIMRAINQIANVKYLQGDELNQLAERGIPSYALIKEVFGTSDTEELKKKGIESRQVIEGLTLALSKMSRVEGGDKNVFENLFAALEMGVISAGAALNNTFLPRVKELTGVIDEMVDSGVIGETFSEIADMIAGTLGSGSTEDILYDMLAELKTIAEGFRNLVDNSKGFVQNARDVWDWLTTPLGGPDRERVLREREKGDVSLPAQRERFLNEMELKKDLARKNREKKGKKDGDKAPGTDTDPTKIISPILETARNTARMVNLQQRQNQITDKILGGSGRPGIDAVTMGQLRSGGRRGRSMTPIERMIRELTATVYEAGHNAALQNSLAAASRKS